MSARVVRAAAILALVVVAAGSAIASSRSPLPGPLAVERSTLTQSHGDVVWSVMTSAPFSPDELQRDQRAICLLLERGTAPAPAGVIGEVCVKHPGDAAHPTLFWRPVTRAGPSGGGVIGATVTRAGGDGLTASFTPGSIGERFAPIHWQVLSAVYGRPSCPARRLGGIGCGELYPSRPALTALQSPAPTGCAAAGPAYVTGSTLQDPGKVVALTFDDGPWSDTAQFLDVLEREHAAATFFQIGRQLSSYGAPVDNRMLADGDVIGDHTWDHVVVAGAGVFAQSEIARDAAAIKALTGFTPCLFRAPYGATSPALVALARRLGFTTVQWDVDPSDWGMPGSAVIEQRVIDAVRPGSIVIQHDGGGNRTQTLAALPHEIETLRANGYRFVTVPQLLGLRMTY